MAHDLIRALIIPEIVNKISTSFQVDEMQALDMFYRSPIGKSYADDSLGLYGESANYVFWLFEKWINSNQTQK